MRPLTLLVLAAVLFGALLHAAWNASVKWQPDKFMAAVLIATGAGIVALPLLAFAPIPPAAAWPYIVASSVIHVGYFALVAFAYRLADLGAAYPLTRGSAPLLTAVFAFLLIGEALTPSAWLAVIAIACGIIVLSADSFLRGGLAAPAAAGAFINAGVIVLYTLVDGLGARITGDGLAYGAWMLAGTAALLALLMLAVRGKELAHAYQRSWPFALGAGALALASYAIALWAMTKAPIGLVAALRETSVLFAAILGAALFKEPFGPTRWIALALIVGGIAALRLA
jgi:drug/metabolite transporter (DMT)-like permease